MSYLHAAFGSSRFGSISFVASLIVFLPSPPPSSRHRCSSISSDIDSVCSDAALGVLLLDLSRTRSHRELIFLFDASSLLPIELTFSCFPQNLATLIYVFRFRTEESLLGPTPIVDNVAEENSTEPLLQLSSRQKMKQILSTRLVHIYSAFLFFCEWYPPSPIYLEDY